MKSIVQLALQLLPLAFTASAAGPDEAAGLLGAGLVSEYCGDNGCAAVVNHAHNDHRLEGHKDPFRFSGWHWHWPSPDKHDHHSKQTSHATTKKSSASRTGSSSHTKQAHPTPESRKSHASSVHHSSKPAPTAHSTHAHKPTSSSKPKPKPKPQSKSKPQASSKQGASGSRFSGSESSGSGGSGSSGSDGYPFSRVVAFGDNLSDNGNGSYAHHVVTIGEPNNSIYGHRTWTDGPVAVSYLVDMLGVPLAIDYAFGHAEGGSRIGATINDSYTDSEYAPDGFTQVHNYTSSSGYTADEVASTLHFLWIGNNDINLLHLSAAQENNTQFGVEMSTQMSELVGRLIDFGAEHVFVPGLYAKQLSPSWRFYAKNETERGLLGHAIMQANTAIQQSLESNFGDKVLYYDVFGRMVDIWNNHDSFGITYVGDNFCDGYSQEDWDLCVTDGKGDEFYWMQYLDMTTRVDFLIAQDMHQAIAAKYGVSL